MIKVYGPKPRKFALRVLEQLKIFARDGVEIIPGQRKFFVIEQAEVYHYPWYLFWVGDGREAVCVRFYLFDKSQGEFEWTHQEEVLPGDPGTYENPIVEMNRTTYWITFGSSRSLKYNLRYMFWYLTICLKKKEKGEQNNE